MLCNPIRREVEIKLGSQHSAQSLRYPPRACIRKGVAKPVNKFVNKSSFSRLSPPETETVTGVRLVNII